MGSLSDACQLQAAWRVGGCCFCSPAPCDGSTRMLDLGRTTVQHTTETQPQPVPDVGVEVRRRRGDCPVIGCRLRLRGCSHPTALCLVGVVAACWVGQCPTCTGDIPATPVGLAPAGPADALPTRWPTQPVLAKRGGGALGAVLGGWAVACLGPWHVCTLLSG